MGGDGEDWRVARGGIGKGAVWKDGWWSVRRKCEVAVRRVGEGFVCE